MIKLACDSFPEGVSIAGLAPAAEYANEVSQSALEMRPINLHVLCDEGVAAATTAEP